MPALRTLPKLAPPKALRPTLQTPNQWPSPPYRNIIINHNSINYNLINNYNISRNYYGFNNVKNPASDPTGEANDGSGYLMFNSNKHS